MTGKFKKTSLVEAVKVDFADTALEMFKERKAAAPYGTKDMFSGKFIATEKDIKKKYMPILKDMALLMQQYGCKLEGLGKECLTWTPEPESWLDE